MDAGHFNRLAESHGLMRELNEIGWEICKNNNDSYQCKMIIDVLGRLSSRIVAMEHAIGVTCPRCKGRGYRIFQDEIEDSPGHFIDVDVKRVCKSCDGKGRVAA